MLPCRNFISAGLWKNWDCITWRESQACRHRVTGTPQRGKSYVAGLIAERLIGLGYCVVVIDPEGDHVGLVP